jgi:transposase InsO family protein
LIVHHDQDPIFTGCAWTARLLLKDHVQVSYALRGGWDNTEMESFNSRFRSENRSLLLDASMLSALGAVVSRRMNYYNHERRHSTLGYRVPSASIATMQPWS